MPKCSKTQNKHYKSIITKKCPSGHSAASNSARNCGLCCYTFPIRIKTLDGRGRSSKRCSFCKTMAKSNNAKVCLSCHTSFDIIVNNSAVNTLLSGIPYQTWTGCTIEDLIRWCPVVENDFEITEEELADIIS